MRSSVKWVPSLFLLASVVACAPSAEDDTNDQTQDVTGGSGAIESPVVYLFESADQAVLPKCAGALLSKTIAVTAKACAKEGMSVGRAADKDGRGARATIAKVHVPEGDDADIAVVELDRAIGGTRALVTHMPLRDGYSVNGVASADGSGIFSPDKGEASSVKARMVSETEMHGAIVPAKGSEICAADLGAPVCSSTAAKILGVQIRGTCGLAGIVVGAPEANTPNAPKVAPDEAPPAPPAAGDAPAAEATGCSAGAWKVAHLGRHAEFLKRFAPEAFEPLVIDEPVLRRFPYAPPGLWGYETGGKVAECKIETAKLEPIKAGAEAKVTAKVSFAEMQERAAPFGRVGIAPKSAPAKMRWFPAKTLQLTIGEAFEATFEGVVSADADGEYVVAFRASANGGEEWTACDLDGIANGFSVEKALELVVGEIANEPKESGEAPAEPGNAPTKPGKTSPQDTPPSTGEDDYSDPSYPTDESDDDVGARRGRGADSDDDMPVVTAKKKSGSGGCSASPRGASGSALPMLGILVGLGLLGRRRPRA